MRMRWLILLALVSCAAPIITPPEVTPVEVVETSTETSSAVAPVPPSIGDGVKLAKYIRLPGSIVARGAIGAFSDPDEALCTEADSVYLFYDDFSIVQYKPFEGGFNTLNAAARVTVEIRNRDFPESPWDYIAVAPPTPPPATVVTPDPDPMPPAGVAYYLTKTHDIAETYTYEPGGQTYASWCNAVTSNLEITNRDRPADDQWHLVFGADYVAQ